MKVPDNIMAIVDACFAANIGFELHIFIDGVPFRIISTDEGKAELINQYNLCVGDFEKD